MADFVHKAVTERLTEIIGLFQSKHLQAQCLTLFNGDSLEILDGGFEPKITHSLSQNSGL